jgi:hypothetical protein
VDDDVGCAQRPQLSTPTKVVVGKSENHWIGFSKFPDINSNNNTSFPVIT